MVRIGTMASAFFPLNRRELMAGLGATALSPVLSSSARAQARPSVALQARTDALALRPGGPDTQVGSWGQTFGSDAAIPWKLPSRTICQCQQRRTGGESLARPLPSR